MSEYVIKGNAAVLKCNIPSFVADFVRVDGWIASDGTEYAASSEFGKTCNYAHTSLQRIRTQRERETDFPFYTECPNQSPVVSFAKLELLCP